MKKPHLVVFGKGIIVGGSLLVPGVSGGSMAMILGIYDALIRSVSSFLKDIRQNLLFLITFTAGALLGMLLFAKPLLFLVDTFHLPSMYFFMGAVAGSIPMIFRKADVKKFSFGVVFYPFIGILLVYLMNLLPAGMFGSRAGSGFTHFFMLGLAGIITAVALVLPGISVSYMLLMLGMYEDTMYAITTLHLPYLLPLGIGGVAGIILTTRLLEYVLDHYTKASYLVILGFVIGAVILVFPGLPSGLEWVFCPLLFFIGFFIIRKLSALES